jgi:O-antigen/teichoic acid export membrane protein
MTQFVNPLSSQLDARNDFDSLRELIILSVQGAYLVFAPLAVFLIAFGRELLTLWVGKSYVSAYPLLVLITLGMGSAAAQFSVQSMLFGIERHKQLMWYRVAEGVSITVLGSIALYGWGLEAFAFVIAVTLLSTNLFFIPLHLCKILDLPLRRYLLQGCVKPCILALPAAVVLVVLRFILPVESWPAMVLVLLMGGLTYGLTLLLVTLKRSRPTLGWASIGILRLLEQRFFRTCSSETPMQLDTIASGK